MERKTFGENMHICVVCNKNINEEESKASNIDGLWICSSNCLSKFQKEKKKWTQEEWDELCKMQASYEERKRAQINTAKEKAGKIKK